MPHHHVPRIAFATIVLAGALGFATSALAQTQPSTTTSPDVIAGPPTKVVKVLDNFFAPKKVTVIVGTKVTWKWRGVAAHNVAVKRGPQKFTSKTISKGKFTRTISKPGKFVIECTIHPGMEMQLRAEPAPPVTTTTVVGGA